MKKMRFYVKALPFIISLSLMVIGCAGKNGGASGNVRQFSDLGRERVRIAIADPLMAPAGKYAEQILEKLGAKDAELKQRIQANIVTREPNVRAVVDKVLTKEVDAGFVYGTDVYEQKTGLTIIEIPEDIRVVPEYAVGILTESDDKSLADAFVNYVMSEKGQKILKKYGFLTAIKGYDYDSPRFDGQTLVVYAASALTDAFNDISLEFERETGASIRFKFAASGALRQLIESGAVGGDSGADVYASANLEEMEALKNGGFVDDVKRFAQNTIVVISPK